MSIDVKLQTERKERFAESLSSNLMEMAVAANLYAVIWTPNRLCAINGVDDPEPRAEALIAALEGGLFCLRVNKEYFRNARGLSDFAALESFASAYLIACKKWPDALVVVT